MVPDYWAVVPAAGIGARMRSHIPKQYLRLNEHLVIEQTLARLITHPMIRGIIIAIAEADQWWDQTLFAAHPDVVRVVGGAERCHSVLNALEALKRRARADDWVLVHDAARPCVRHRDLDDLIHAVAEHSVGGLLGVPVRDTMKRTDADRQIQKTVSREKLWHAYTPQMFRLRGLDKALSAALERGLLVTDDANAMELAGLSPLMVEGHADNIKITRPEDLALAAFYLSRQEQEHAGRAGV